MNKESQVLSERIATIAEAIGLPGTLLWDPAHTCPQGHKNWDICGRPDAFIGEFCWECWKEHEEIRTTQFYDQTWHPEWRIGRQAKNFMNPSTLWPVIVALRLGLTITPYKDTEWFVWIEEVKFPVDDTIQTGATDPHLPDALAISLLHTLDIIQRRRERQIELWGQEKGQNNE